MQSLKDIQQLLAQRKEQPNAIHSAISPIILVPGYFSPTQTGSWPLSGSDAKSVESLDSAGAIPISVAVTPLIEGDPFDILHNDDAFQRAFEKIWELILQMEIHGVCVAGGGDLYSGLYGQKPGVQTGIPDLWRDLWERYLLLIGRFLRWPTLGICRGMQHMHVVGGGELIQDLSSQWESLWKKYCPNIPYLPLERHRQRGRFATPDTFAVHPISIDATSRLARLIRGGQMDRSPARNDLLLLYVLSQHHQSIGFITSNEQVLGGMAPGHQCVAIANDGVIEAFESTDPTRFWLGVQYHPEWPKTLRAEMGGLDSSAASAGLFQGYVRACQEYVPLAPHQLIEMKPDLMSAIRWHDHKRFGKVPGQKRGDWFVSVTHSPDALEPLLPTKQNEVQSLSLF